MENNMNSAKEKKLIYLIGKMRKSPKKRSLVKNKILDLFGDNSNYPDLTDVWNLAEKLSRMERITIWEMNEIWGALSELKEEGKCKLDDYFE